ncbi:MAG: exo-alpha-sialidase, partial [Mangrovibacterium sp.]
MQKPSTLILLTPLLLYLFGCTENGPRSWEEGILLEEFIYEQAPFPSCHASTIAENAQGELVTAWFGGTRERHPDVCIYVSRKVDRSWTEPVNVADGIRKDGSRLPTWNPVLYQVPGGELQLYYKIG